MASIIYEATNPPSAVLKRATAATREALPHAAKFWHRTYLGRHFEPSAVRRYGYSPRSKKYQLAKAKQQRHQKPLVKTGRSRMLAKRHVDYVARKRRGGDEVEGSAVMRRLPKYFFQHPHKAASGRFIDKPAELSAIAAEEERVSVELIRRNVLRRMGEQVEKVRVRIS